MDIVFVENLKIAACIGVWEWERRVKQNLIVDIQLGCDIHQAAQSDSIEDAISYKDVATRIHDFVAESNFKLIESVAESIATIILEEFSATWCRVKISKPRAVEKASNVGVIIERGSKPASTN